MIVTNIEPLDQSKYYSKHIRVVFLGKTGNGKTASINSLIGEKRFESGSNAASVTTTCQGVSFNLNGQNILIIDTPGFFDTQQNEETILNELKNIMHFTRPGPNVFVVTIKIGRATKEDEECLNKIKNFFGDSVFNHSLVLFTRLDNLESLNLEDWIFEENNKVFKRLVEVCKRIYLGTDNHSENSNLEFRRKFFQSLNLLIERNSQSYYTIEQFQASQKFIETENRKKLEQQLKLDQLAKEAAEKQRQAVALRAIIAAYQPPSKKRPWWKL